MSFSQSERLEERALLSATADPSVAEVAPIQGRKEFDFPQIAGTWDLTVNQEPAGTAVITQDGTKVTAIINILGFEQLAVKDKFTKRSPYGLDEKIKINDDELGKFTIELTLTFPSEPQNPNQFLGLAQTPQGLTSFSATKQITPPPASVPKAAPQFENVAGEYDFTLFAEGEQTEVGVLNLTQSGKGGKNLDGTITFEAAPPITVDGKFDKKDPSHITGKILRTDPESGKTFKANFTANFNDLFNAFEGTAEAKNGVAAGFNATQVEPPAPSSVGAPAKAAPQFPDVSGAWSFTSPNFAVEDIVMTVTQSGKGNRNVEGTVTFNGLTFSFSGKFNKKNQLEVAGKAQVPASNPADAFAKPFKVTFATGYQSFSGSVIQHKIDIVIFSATKLIITT